MTTKQQIIEYFDSTIKNYDTAVSMNKKVLGNTPVIKGTRIPISLIIACFRDGMTLDEISNTYNVTIENIETAMNFVIQLLDFPFQWGRRWFLMIDFAEELLKK